MATVTRSYNPYIDALIHTSKLDNTNLTYYFAENPEEAGSTDADKNFIAKFTAEQQANFALALKCYSSVCNLTFTPYAYSSLQPNNLPNLTATNWRTNWGGFSTGAGIFIPLDSDPANPSSYKFFTMLHEIGHSVGLRHNFEPGSDQTVRANHCEFCRQIGNFSDSLTNCKVNCAYELWLELPHLVNL